MTQLEKSFDSILSNFQMDLNYELLVLYKSELFFIPIERLVTCISNLPIKQQDKVVLKAERFQLDKPRFLNLLHDLALPMLSIKV